MNTFHRALLASSAAILVLTPTLSVAAPMPILNKCIAGKNECVRMKVSALLKCYEKAERKGLDPQTDRRTLRCLQRANDKFDGGNRPSKGCFAKLEARQRPERQETICPATGDSAAIEATVDAFVGSMVARLEGAKIAFVTSARYDGNLGGLEGADAICQAHATTAGLPGIYKAWLSDVTDSPSTRFVQADVRYVRTDGVTIANDWNDLLNRRLLINPLQADEHGKIVITSVWTNTRPDGTRDSQIITCDSWTSAIPGDLVSIGQTYVTAASNWTRGELLAFCSWSLNLYCFQQ